MEQQKLPNATTVLVLGIVSIVGTCCCTGLVGVICGLIGMNLYNKDKVLYDQNPASYTDFNNLNTGRILCIIGLVLGAIQLLYFVYILATIGWDGYMEQMRGITNMGRG